MPTTHTKVLSRGAWSWDTSPRASPSTSPCPTGRRASTRRATSTSTTTPMRRSPSATPRAPTPQSTPQLLLKQPTRATAELRFPGRPATLPGPRSCPIRRRWHGPRPGPTQRRPKPAEAPDARGPAAGERHSSGWALQLRLEASPRTRPSTS